MEVRSHTLTSLSSLETVSPQYYFGHLFNYCLIVPGTRERNKVTRLAQRTIHPKAAC